MKPEDLKNVKMDKMGESLIKQAQDLFNEGCNIVAVGIWGITEDSDMLMMTRFIEEGVDLDEYEEDEPRPDVGILTLRKGGDNTFEIGGEEYAVPDSYLKKGDKDES